MITNTCLVRRDLDLDAPPDDTAQGNLHFEPTQPLGPSRNVHQLDSRAGKRQDTPGFSQGTIEDGEKRVDVATDDPVDVLRGPPCPVKSVLEVGAPLEQEVWRIGLIDRPLQDRDDDC